MFAVTSNCTSCIETQRAIILKYKGVSIFSIQVDTIQDAHTTGTYSIMFKYAKDSMKASLISQVSLKTHSILGNIFQADVLS